MWYVLFARDSIETCSNYSQPLAVGCYGRRTKPDDSFILWLVKADSSTLAYMSSERADRVLMFRAQYPVDRYRPDPIRSGAGVETCSHLANKEPRTLRHTLSPVSAAVKKHGFMQCSVRLQHEVLSHGICSTQRQANPHALSLVPAPLPCMCIKVESQERTHA
jgi:hypothetical protein